MKTKLLTGALCLLLASLTPLSAQQEQVRVMALFADKAMVNINGQNHLMNKGDQVAGVTLVSASGRAAVVRFSDGVEQTLGLNQTIQHGFKKAQNPRLTIFANDYGMFELDGAINGQRTRFLLDTGATFIALSQAEADRLAIAYETAPIQKIQTASEVVPAWNVNLDRVKVGDIVIANVEAVILKGNSPSRALLGMSFLQHIKMQRNGAAMILEQKY